MCLLFIAACGGSDPAPTGGTSAPAPAGSTSSAAGSTTPKAGTTASGAAGMTTATGGTRAPTAGTTGMTTNPVMTAGAIAMAGSTATGGTAAPSGGTTATGGTSAGGATATAGTGAGGSTGSGTGMLGGALKYTGAFTMGMSQIAAKYKCPSEGGENKSPPLSWTGGPADTKSFALVLFDTKYNMLHWALWDIPATVFDLPEGLPSGYELTTPAGAHQASNMGTDKHAYWGPCTSSGSAFPAAGMYEYRLYALKEAKLPLMESSSGMQAQTAIEGAKLESVIWAGVPAPR